MFSWNALPVINITNLLRRQKVLPQSGVNINENAYNVTGVIDIVRPS